MTFTSDEKGGEPLSRASRAMADYGGGDDSAFAVVYDELAPQLFRYLMHLGHRDRSLAEDLLQGTFLHLHAARGRFIRGADVGPWARTIARRLVIDDARRRKHERLRRVRESLEALADVVPSGEATGEAQVIAAELRLALRERVDTLPALQREAFCLIRTEGLRAEEAAAELGTTTIAVKQRFQRALESLRKVARAQ